MLLKTLLEVCFPNLSVLRGAAGRPGPGGQVFHDFPPPGENFPGGESGFPRPAPSFPHHLGEIRVEFCSFWGKQAPFPPQRRVSHRGFPRRRWRAVEFFHGVFGVLSTFFRDFPHFPPSFPHFPQGFPQFYRGKGGGMCGKPCGNCLKLLFRRGFFDSFKIHSHAVHDFGACYTL